MLNIAKEENVFSGPLAEEYDLLNLICPGLPVLRRLLGDYIASWRPAYPATYPLKALEIGCGSGASALSILIGRDDLHLYALDSSVKMLEQAKTNLASWAANGRVEFAEVEAVEGLGQLPEASLDIVASSYAIHNFEQGYREQAHAGIYRALRPGGLFINADRYAIDDYAQHLAQIQKDVRHWFKTMAALDRIGLLEEWVLHLISDEHAEHIMRLTPAIENLKAVGFGEVKVEHREGVDTLLTAVKPM
jgi:ubiquinone/menaquinone biosynthesis C-methylase UbiE